MPALEQVAGFPLPERGDVLVRVHGDSKATGGYAGQIEGLVVDLVDTATNYDLVHELAHGWFSDRFVVSRDRADRWVIEGLATYAAIQACRVQPALGDAASWHAQALARRTRDPAERPYLSSRGTRYPMREGTDDEAFAFDWYARAYAFLHLLEARLGEAGLRALNRRIAAESPRLPYLYLAEIRAVDPDGVRLLGGWHTTDDFHRAMHPDRLSDADGDGLSAAHEQALGTRDDALDSDGDGASDGCEYWWFRSDPASAESVPPEPRALKAKETTAWWRLGGSTGEAWDAARDVPREFSAVHDVRSLHVHADEAWITIAATFHRSPPPDLVLQLGIDKDGDDDYELVFQARPGQHPEFCRLDGRWEGVDWRLVSLERVEARGIELRFALPRAMLGADLAGEVRVFGGTLGLDSTESLVYADSISDWLSLNLP